MSLTLVIAGGLLGLASTPHCAAMCSAPCAALARGCDPARPARALAAWHAGRIAAYAAAGAAAAASVGVVARAAEASMLVRPFWTLLQVAVVVLGLALLWSGRTPRWLDGLAQRIGAAVRPRAGVVRFVPRRGSGRAMLAGAAWVALPCGVLYAALAVAALADGPALGAAVMAAFGGGSALGLVAAPLLWQRLARVERVATLRLAGALLALGSAWSLWHGLGAPGAEWCLDLAMRTPLAVLR